MSQQIRETQLGSFPDKKQLDYLNVVGPDGAGSFRGRHRVFFQGNTGLVATQFGLAGMVTVGRGQTGVYTISFPKVKDVDILANIHCPSGVSYTTSVKGVSGAVQIVGMSGVAELHITRPVAVQTVSTGGVITSVITPHNPVTGTYVDLWFDAMPNSAYVPY